MTLTKAQSQKRDYEKEMEVTRFYAIQGITTDVQAELLKRVQEFPKFASYHEGYAIIAEEVDELWEEVKTSKTDEWYKSQGYDVVPAQHKERMRREAIQIAAMAARFAMELC